MEFRLKGICFLFEQDLIDAIEVKDVESAYSLIEQGVDVNYILKEFTEPTVLHIGVESKILGIVKVGKKTSFVPFYLLILESPCRIRVPV